ncbi:MAG: peptide ABC transporter substrate-binding protein [Anaerolineae bacterium]|nr:peptide ABC transporter substrate-binding protein [Anaerolineae bacterium]
MKRFSVFLVLVMLVAMISPMANLATAQEAKTIIIGTTDEPSGLDSGYAYATHDWEILKNTGDALMGYVPGTADLIPRLAADYPEVSDDGLVWTFTLREGIQFADGTPLTAQIVADSVTRALTLEGDITGFVQGFIAGIEVIDELTVAFTLTQPYGFFGFVAATGPFIPMNPNTNPIDELVTNPETILGVGAYMMTEWQEDEQLVLERNPYYWDTDNEPYYDRVIIRYFADPTTLSLAVENGEIDIAWRTVGPVEAARLQEIEGLVVTRINAPTLRYLVLNHAFPPHDNNNVNAAIAAAIDRETLVDRVFEGRTVPAYSMVPAGVPYQTEAFLDAYGFQDLDTAIALLEGEGYSADNMLELTLWYPPEHYGTTTADVVQVLKEQLESTGLITVTLEVQNWATYIAAATDGEYPFFILGWFPDYPDPSTWLDPFGTCTQSPSMGVNYCDENMENYLITAGTSTDPAVREENYAKAQELWTQHAPTIPLFFEPEYITVREGIEGVLIGPPFEFLYSELYEE